MIALNKSALLSKAVNVWGYDLFKRVILDFVSILGLAVIWKFEKVTIDSFNFNSFELLQIIEVFEFHSSGWENLIRKSSLNFEDTCVE